MQEAIFIIFTEKRKPKYMFGAHVKKIDLKASVGVAWRVAGRTQSAKGAEASGWSCGRSRWRPLRVNKIALHCQRPEVVAGVGNGVGSESLLRKQVKPFS